MPKKVKYTSGVLCRDKDRNGYVGFFPGRTRSDVWLGDSSGFWWGYTGPERPKRHWYLSEFTATYDLTDENGKRCAPPRKGQAFECDVEL